MHNEQIIELIAQTIYTDSFRQYGTCDTVSWKKTSETQREFCRGQANAVFNLLKLHNFLK